MSNDRRDFLRLSLATGAALSAPASLFAREAALQGEPSKKLKLLVFGGTGFIGPKLVDYALSRGHEVTLFNRGRTNTHLFADLPKVIGDRDPDKGEGIKGLAEGEWDVVFDDNGYYPRHVKASAELLAGRVQHYIYVSSVSAFAGFGKSGQDEDAPLAQLADPTVETMGASFENYGGLKVLCERAVQAAYPQGATVVRPGYIVGPGDPTDRFTYWPVRIDRGGDALIPGTKEDPVQVIDVRDLSEWMVHLAEKRTLGVFNACGPAEPLAWGKVIDACVAASAKPAKLHWVSTEELQGENTPPLPIWAPPGGEEGGVHTVSNARAVAAGLGFRPIALTVSDTLGWFQSLPAERQAALKAGLAPADEERILKALGSI
jgi:2'-hydroxyisoflavone reductase